MVPYRDPGSWSVRRWMVGDRTEVEWGSANHCEAALPGSIVTALSIFASAYVSNDTDHVRHVPQLLRLYPSHLP